MPNFHYSPNNCCNIVHPVRQCYFLRADRNSWELPLGYVLPTMAPFPQLRPSSDFNRETWAAACVGSGRMCDICAEMHVFPNIEVKRRGRALPGSVVMETIGECGWHRWLVSGKEKGIYYLIFFFITAHFNQNSCFSSLAQYLSFHLLHSELVWRLSFPFSAVITTAACPCG